MLKYKQKQFAKLQQGVISVEQYKRVFKLCKQVQRKAYARYQYKLRRDINEMSKGDRAFWSLTKELSGLDNQPSSSGPDVDKLADHFATKMSNGAGVDFTGRNLPEYPVKPLKGLKIRFKRVCQVLERLDISKSANGPGPRVLRECASVLAAPVTKLFRCIVRSADFPLSWKVGRVTALHKRKSVSDPANYRPVTVLNNLESVFEATVEEQLYAWIEPLIPECQFGFLRKCGTSDHGLLLSSMMISCLERRSQRVLISLDVKGAFDRCWWSKLLARLCRAGMKGRALRLMKDYFRERFIQVASGERW